MEQQAVRLHIDIEKLHGCVSKLFIKNDLQIIEWDITPIDYKTPNFTTAGIYRIYGLAKIQEEALPWSLVLKIIQPENEEKNTPQHHNYWRREALILESGILKQLPNVIYSPTCYSVDYRVDGTIWLWMEEIKENNDVLRSEEEFAFIARQLGKFNGAYLTGQSLPDEPWICQEWLKSWVTASKKYAGDPSHNYSLIKNKYSKIDHIWERYLSFNKNINKYLHALSKLPRVLAHQDLSQKNMYLEQDYQEKDTLILIDWQFMSISGIGEDLGKLYGVAMSTNSIPQDQFFKYIELLFTNYVDGLRHAGWEGDSRLARYGFCASVAMRSVWEVPQLMKLLATSPNRQSMISPNKVRKLINIVNIHMELAEEADSLIKIVLNEHSEMKR